MVDKHDSRHYEHWQFFFFPKCIHTRMSWENEERSRCVHELVSPWCANSAEPPEPTDTGPPHHLHLFIYPEADLSSIQLGESLPTSGSKQSWLAPDQCTECILNQNLLCHFFNAIKIQNWLLEKWHELKSLPLHRPHSSHSCPIHPSPISALHETHLQFLKSIPLLLFVVLGLFSLTYPPLISLLLSLI